MANGSFQGVTANMKYSVAVLLALCSLCVASTLYQRDAASHGNNYNNHKYDYYNDNNIRENDNEKYIFKSNQSKKVDHYLVEKQQTVLHLLSNLDHNILPEHLSLLGRTFKLHENLDKFNNKNIVKDIIKNYNQKSFLPEHEVFSPSIQQHYNQAAKLFYFLYGAQDWDTLKQASVWVRQRMNPHQFAYAFTATILNHPATRGVVLPALYEVMPNLFVPATAMQKIYKANMLGYNSATVQANYTNQNLNTDKFIDRMGMLESKINNYGSHNPANIFADNDGSMLKMAGVTENIENRMSYFTEDVGINAFHSGFHMQNPAFYGTSMMYDSKIDFTNKLLYKNIDTIEEMKDMGTLNNEHNRRRVDEEVFEEVDKTMDRKRCRNCHHKRNSNNWENGDKSPNVWNGHGTSDEMIIKNHHRDHKYDHHKHSNNDYQDKDDKKNIWNVEDVSDTIVSYTPSKKHHKDHHERHHGNNDNDSNENIWNNDDNMGKDMSDDIMSRNKKHHKRHHDINNNDSNENIWNKDDNMEKDMSDDMSYNKKHHKRHHDNNDNDSNENVWINSDDMRNDKPYNIMNHKKNCHYCDNNDNNKSLKSKLLNNVGMGMDFIFRRDCNKPLDNSKEINMNDNAWKIDEHMIKVGGIEIGKTIKSKHNENNQKNCKKHTRKDDENCKIGTPELENLLGDNVVNEMNYNNMYNNNNMNRDNKQAVKRGESFYYTHQQLYARYVLERLSNDLPIPHSMNFEDKIQIGYNPNLQHSNGQAIPARPANTKFLQQLLETTTNNNNALMPNNNQAENPQIYEKRLMEVAESGFVINKDGSKTKINTENGVGILANLIAAPADSLNPDYYGDYFNTAKHAIGNIVDPGNKNGVAPGPVANIATAARDPAYYQLLAKLNQIFKNLQNNFGPYTQKQLSFSGMKIKQFDISRLITYFDTFKINVNNALNNNLNMEDENYIIKFQRLNNKPFIYKLKLSTEKSTNAVIRIFIGPKYDSNGQRFTLPQASQYFVQLDQFVVKLNRGENIVERSSLKSPNYVQDQPSFKELWDKVQAAKERNQPIQFDETESRHCGFPQRAQLPKGKPSGQKFVVYAIVTETDLQIDEFTHYSRHFQTFYCGGNNNNKLHDRKTIGFPFDRPIVDINYNSPNQYFKTVTIYHHNSSKKI